MEEDKRGGSGGCESMDLGHPPKPKTLAIYPKIKGVISDLLATLFNNLLVVFLVFSLLLSLFCFLSFDLPPPVLDVLHSDLVYLLLLTLIVALVQKRYQIKVPKVNTIAIDPNNEGIISDLLKFVRGRNREEKPLLDFDCTNNLAYQSGGLLVSNSEKTNAREPSGGVCMTEGVPSLVDSTTRISSTDFDAPGNSAHLVRANQSGPIMLNSEKKETREGLIGECLTESVLSLDDSTKRKWFPVFDATEIKAHLVSAYQSGPVVSLSENQNRGEASKRECITKSILGLEDLQQHFGGRPDAAAKSFRAIYDPGFHTPDSISRKSFEVLETLPARKQPNDGVPLLLPGRLTLEGCVQQEKSPDLPRVMQFNGVEQRVTKMPRYLGGLTAQSTSSSCGPIGLPDGGHIVLLDALDQSTKNIEHVATADQCSPTLSLPEKKMVRKTLNRNCRTMNVIFEEKHQRFVRRCEGATKSLGAMCISRKHGINQVSMVEPIHKQSGIHQWPFLQSAVGLPDGGHIPSLSEKKIVRKTLKRKCRSMSVLSLEDHKRHVDRRWEDAAKSHGAKRICRQLVIHNLFPECIRKQLGIHQWPFQRSTIGLTDGGHILPLSEKKIVRKTLKRKCRSMSVLSLVDRQQHVYWRWEDAAKNIGAKRIYRQLVIHRVSIAKRICRQHGIHHRWPFQHSATGLPDGGHILPLSEKKIVRKTLKRKCRSMSVIRLVDRQQHVDRRWKDATKNIGAKRICRQLVIHHVSIAKLMCRQHGIYHRWPFERGWATMKGYSLGDKKPVEVICLSIDGKLVSRLRRIYISWLGRFSPRPSALPRGGLIEGPIALSSSEFASTNNLAQRVGQDQRGSGASGYENERTREQEDPEEIRTSITKDDLLQLHGRMTRKDAAAILHVSVSTVKRKCQEYKIGPWKNGGRKRVLRPPDPHGKRNTSTACMTLSHNVQPGMEGEPVGQNLEANVFRRDFMRGPIAMNTESGSIMVSIPPDQHGERNTSTAHETPSHNVQTGIGGVPVSQNQEANEFRPDFTEGSIPLNTENGSIIGILKIPPFHDSYPGNYPIDYKESENAGSSSEWASQVNDQSTLSNPYQNHNALVFPQPQITSMLSENRGGSIDWGNSLASQAEPFSDTHMSGSSNLAFPTWSDQAAPSQHAEGQSVQSTVYPDHNAVHRFPEGHVFESINWNEHTNSLASQAEPFSDRRISGSSNLTFPTWSDQAAPSQHAEGQSVQSTVYPDHNAVHRFPVGHVFESINWNEHSNSLASQAEPFSDRHISGSIWRPHDQLEGQTMQFTAHPNPNALGLPQFQIASSQVTSANKAAPSQPVASILTERQGLRSVKVKATYGNGNRLIKFPLPLTSGIKELMQEVSKTLDWELGSFDVDYKDEDGDWILMARDDNVSEYLQLLNSIGNQATKLEVRKKVPDTTNICETCGSLKQQRP